MSPEHADLEADWLYDELVQLDTYARETYRDLPADSPNNVKLSLANMIGTIGTLKRHYVPYETAPSDGTPERTTFEPPRHRKKRGAIMSFLLGDSN